VSSAHAKRIGHRLKANNDRRNQRCPSVRFHVVSQAVAATRFRFGGEGGGLKPNLIPDYYVATECVLTRALCENQKNKNKKNLTIKTINLIIT